MPGGQFSQQELALMPGTRRKQARLKKSFIEEICKATAGSNLTDERLLLQSNREDIALRTTL